MDQNVPHNLGFTTLLETSFEEAYERTVAALKSEGFGVLTEIDVQSTLQQRLGVDFRPYKILGACNPPLAHRALEANPEVGLLLPCNVTLSEIAPGRVQVSILDPRIMLSVVSTPELLAIAEEARARLLRVTGELR